MSSESGTKNETETEGGIDRYERAVVRGFEWKSKISRNWFNRSDVPESDPRRAFDESIEVHYPSARNGADAYYHPSGDVVFITSDGQLRTCLNLSDRPTWEQDYVRENAEGTTGDRNE